MFLPVVRRKPGDRQQTVGDYTSNPSTSRDVYKHIVDVGIRSLGQDPGT